MALSDREKQLVIDRLDLLEDAARALVLASLNAFTEWLSNVLYQIFIKIKNVLSQFWQWLRSHF